jgi:hypothetical protein
MSSLPFDLLSPSAPRCCLIAATSTSVGGNVGGEETFRLPRASLDNTIFDEEAERVNVGTDTRPRTGRISGGGGEHGDAGTYVRRDVAYSRLL